MYASEERVDRLEGLIAEAVELHKALVIRFEERDRQFAEQARQIAEQARQFAEQAQLDRAAMRQSSEKVDAQLAKTDEQLAKTDEQLARVDEQLVKTDEQLARVDEQLARSEARSEKALNRLEKMVAQTTNAVDKLTGKWSNFVVGLVLPATKKMFQERGFDIKNIFKGAQSSVEGAEMEIDIMAVSNQYIVAIEIKSTLGIDDVNQHIERLTKFKLAFTIYADQIVIGAVAGIVINEGVDKYAYRNGLFVVGQSGDTVKILNDNKFVPRYF
ncbi:MAG: DUF3782 domain-containing protein [Nitrospirae bacterium]|nr:DUF3782 domain-containing protein [Nitrospirota bacterium]